MRLSLILPLASACLALSGLAGCRGSPIDVNLEKFDALPQLEDLDYAAVGPAENYDYWELRFSFGEPPGHVLGSVGSRETLPPETVAALEALHSDVGFGAGCPPASCYKYIVTVKGQNLGRWTSIADLRRFLGQVDAPQEAALLTDAHSYFWGSERETGAIRSIGTGYEVIALRLVKLCAPVQVNRYLLQVSRSGELSEKASEVWERDEHACI